MHRRDMLKAGLAAGALGFAPRLASAQANFSPVPKGWRTFVLTTRLEPTFASKAWIPLPTLAADDWQRPGTTTWTGNAKRAERVRDPKYGAEMLLVEWAADQQNPLVEVTTQVQAQNRTVALGGTGWSHLVPMLAGDGRVVLDPLDVALDECVSRIAANQPG